MAGAGSIGVGQLVHEHELRTTGERRVQIEFPQCRSAMLDHARRQNRQPFQQGFRFLTPMRFDPADDDVHSVILLFMRRSEHGVRLPDTGRGAEKYLELAARLLNCFSLHPLEQGIWIGASFFHQMCAIGETGFSADGNICISVEEIPESVNESPGRSTTTQARLPAELRDDRVGHALSRECPAQDSTPVH